MVPSDTVLVASELFGDLVKALVYAHVHVFVSGAGYESALSTGVYDYFRHWLIGFYIQRNLYRM